jgi:hypothetical protein
VELRSFLVSFRWLWWQALTLLVFTCLFLICFVRGSPHHFVSVWPYVALFIKRGESLFRGYMHIINESDPRQIVKSAIDRRQSLPSGQLSLPAAPTRAVHSTLACSELSRPPEELQCCWPAPEMEARALASPCLRLRVTRAVAAVLRTPGIQQSAASPRPRARHHQVTSDARICPNTLFTV